MTETGPHKLYPLGWAEAPAQLPARSHGADTVATCPRGWEPSPLVMSGSRTCCRASAPPEGRVELKVSPPRTLEMGGAPDTPPPRTLVMVANVHRPPCSPAPHPTDLAKSHGRLPGKGLEAQRQEKRK